MTTMSIRGVSLFVKVIGHGYPMAIMHGGPGADHTAMLSKTVARSLDKQWLDYSVFGAFSRPRRSVTRMRQCNCR